VPPIGPDSALLAASRSGRARTDRAQRGAACEAWRVSLVCGAILLGGCCHTQPLELKDVDAARSAIRFEHGDFRPELSEYAVQDDPCTGTQVHVASLHGPDSVGMLVVVQAGAGRVLRERSIESSVQELMPEGAEIVWGAGGGAGSGVGHTPYRLFQIADQSLSCVGFAMTFGSPDDANRKPNALYGYFCRDDSRPMTTASAAELLAQVRLTRGG
jgi:hypothetical protein